MSDSEPFTFVTCSQKNALFNDFKHFTSAKVDDVDAQLIDALRTKFPEMTVTAVPSYNVNLLQFAAAGYAQAHLDTETDSKISWRGYMPPFERGGLGSIAEVVFFAKYHYKWGTEDYILYTVAVGFLDMQYILKEPDSGESTLSNSAKTDALIAAIGEAMQGVGKSILVYDGYWFDSTELWNEVQKVSWDDVILEQETKKELTEISEKFFSSKCSFDGLMNTVVYLFEDKQAYEDLGVPWKRGLIFYGPAGNGKTISIKALMHTLYKRKNPIPALYVKSAPETWDIKLIFEVARMRSPCLLVLEDIDTIVTSDTRSYFFNEVDGLANNDGILMVASTNHLEQLDPGLSKRPSRFDRKYLFDDPNLDERVMYCQFWREKLRNNPSVEFPNKLCEPIACITKSFSFAYMQEAFVATLLEIARHSDSDMGSAYGKKEEDKCPDDDELDRFELWRVIKKQVKVLRDQIDSTPITKTFGDEGAPPPRGPPMSKLSLPLPLRSCPRSQMNGIELQHLGRPQISGNRSKAVPWGVMSRLFGVGTSL